MLARRSASPRYEVAKRALDIVGGATALTLLAPVMMAAAVAVLLTMGSPVLYRDRRIGAGGRPFELLKLRTMRALRPGESVPDSDHARLTRVGRFLRATSIDELPSLVNVVRGEMSLVGPRPLPARYLDRYTPRQARRHDVRPGLTGWAQVNGRNAVGWEHRLELDRWYVDHRSLRLDVRILAMTPTRLFRRPGITHPGHPTMPEFTGTVSEGRPGDAR